MTMDRQPTYVFHISMVNTDRTCLCDLHISKMDTRRQPDYVISKNAR